MNPTLYKYFRIISYLEGLSFLFLLCVAMPMKYAADKPEMVTVTGIIHGFFFAAYIIAVLVLAFMYRWKWLRVAGGIIGAFLPFGPFIFDRRIQRG
ncbi:DUF3817 domain-containing protein [Paenibacillus kobensis]|uniref:DUF3817 domain-containing protein n=1 Tax=Paenibacillus kobensis TaxID=59841 RepID=UPI000FD7F27A|nr:DUF3817 domain-containing protein [Paenibacillus kobensis]